LFVLCDLFVDSIFHQYINKHMEAFTFTGSLNPITDDCAICQLALRDEGDLVQLSCNHFFHMNCIEKWNGPANAETNIIINGRVIYATVHQQKRGLCVLCSQPINIKSSVTHDEFIKNIAPPSSPNINLQNLDISSTKMDTGSKALHCDTGSPAPSISEVPTPSLSRSHSYSSIPSSVSTGTFQRTVTSNFKSYLPDGRRQCQGLKADNSSQCRLPQNSFAAPYCSKHVGQKNKSYWSNLKKLSSDKKKSSRIESNR